VITLPVLTSSNACFSPTERLAARIASRIAGHAVTVRCDTASVFRAFGGGDATGSVPNRVDPTTGRYAETSRVIHLNPGTCGSLQAFAQAPVKPTRCKDAANRAVPCFTARRVTPATARESYLCAPRPSGCFAVGTGNSAFWHRYARDAYAIWVLAHEAIHAGQAVIAHRGEWIQYSTPNEGGAEYIAVCLPAFSPDTVHRDS